MKGKLVATFGAAYDALYRHGLDCALIKVQDEYMTGFLVLIRADLVQAPLPAKFIRASPQGFYQTFGFPPKCPCHIVEESDVSVVLDQLKTAGYAVELEQS